MWRNLGIYDSMDTPTFYAQTNKFLDPPMCRIPVVFSGGVYAHSMCVDSLLTWGDYQVGI